jgi:hypothetical protein
MHATPSNSVIGPVGSINAFVTDPQGGGFCELDLDGGQRIRVSHQKMSAKAGWLTIDMLKFLGFSPDRIFVCNLDSPEGKAALEQLTRDVPSESVLATPLGAFVGYINDCWSVEEVQAKCRTLMSRPGLGR